MYEYEGLHDVVFIALYCVAAFAALVAAVYLLCRRGNAFMQEKGPENMVTIESPGGMVRMSHPLRSSLRLRRWTAALMAAIVASHVWWYVVGQWWLEDDRLVRNIVNIALDHVTLVPLTMAVLLALLQDRRRPLWPWLVAEVAAVVVTAVMGIAGRDEFWGYDVMGYCQLVLIAGFIVYYALALRHYGRWLRDNYADLEHKEVWQSLIFAVGLFVVYEVYTSNGGELLREYLSQVVTLVIIAFLVWRVETLEELTESEE